MNYKHLPDMAQSFLKVTHKIIDKNTETTTTHDVNEFGERV